MSHCFDVMRRAFERHFDRGDEVSEVFIDLIEEMHSANHRVDDAINKHAGVTREASRLELVSERRRSGTKGVGSDE